MEKFACRSFLHKLLKINQLLSSILLYSVILFIFSSSNILHAIERCQIKGSNDSIKHFFCRSTFSACVNMSENSPNIKSKFEFCKKKCLKCPTRFGENECVERRNDIHQHRQEEKLQFQILNQQEAYKLRICEEVTIQARNAN